MAGSRDYDSSKLEELIVYVADCSYGDARFGKTKLNKILFFSDFEAYRQLGTSITGATYQHLPWGPAPHQMVPCLDALQRGNAVLLRGEGTFVGTQERVVALRDAKLDDFSAEEIAIVNRVIDQLRDLTNQEVSDLSHETVAWQVTADYQEIPYGAAVLSAEPPTEDDLMWLGEVANAYATVGND